MVTGKGTVLQKAKVMCQLVQEKNPSGTLTAFSSWQWSRVAGVGWGWGGYHVSVWEAPLQAGQPGFPLAFSPGLAPVAI